MDLRKTILSTSSEMFLRYGLRSVTIDDICHELRISKKTFYTHFHQKDELIEELLNDMRMKRCSFMNLLPDDNVIDRLLGDIKMFKKYHEEKKKNFFYDLNKYYPEINQKHIAAMDKISSEYTMEALKKGIADGYFRDDMDLELMCRYLYFRTGHQFRQMQEECKISMAQMAEFLVDSFVRLVANEKGLNYYLNKKQK